MRGPLQYLNKRNSFILTEGVITDKKKKMIANKRVLLKICG